jgi:hypothetical protein
MLDLSLRLNLKRQRSVQGSLNKQPQHHRDHHSSSLQQPSRFSHDAMATAVVVILSLVMDQARIGFADSAAAISVHGGA